MRRIDEGFTICFSTKLNEYLSEIATLINLYGKEIKENKIEAAQENHQLKFEIEELRKAITCKVKTKVKVETKEPVKKDNPTKDKKPTKAKK